MVQFQFKTFLKLSLEYIKILLKKIFIASKHVFIPAILSFFVPKNIFFFSEFIDNHDFEHMWVYGDKDSHTQTDLEYSQTEIFHLFVIVGAFRWSLLNKVQNFKVTHKTGWISNFFCLTNSKFIDFHIRISLQNSNRA